MPLEQRDWYDTPAAYDRVFDADTGRETDFLEAVFQRHHRTRGSTRHALEPACGSGRLVDSLSRRGWQVAGFDASQPMLDYARKRCRRHPVTLWEDRMESFVPPTRQRFHLAHCLVSTFKYLLTEAEAQAHLQRVEKALLKGGIHVLGVHLTDYHRRSCEHERWVSSRPDSEVVSNTRTWPADRRQRLERVRNRLRITDCHGERQQETNWQFRTYDAAQLRRTLRLGAPGLEIVACHDFTHDPDSRRGFDDSYSDLVVVMRKR